jgi:hypothetical protein
MAVLIEIWDREDVVLQYILLFLCGYTGRDLEKTDVDNLQYVFLSST